MQGQKSDKYRHPGPASDWQGSRKTDRCLLSLFLSGHCRGYRWWLNTLSAPQDPTQILLGQAASVSLLNRHGQQPVRTCRSHLDRLKEKEKSYGCKSCFLGIRLLPSSCRPHMIPLHTHTHTSWYCNMCSWLTVLMCLLSVWLSGVDSAGPAAALYQFTAPLVNINFLISSACGSVHVRVVIIDL